MQSTSTAKSSPNVQKARKSTFVSNIPIVSNGSKYSDSFLRRILLELIIYTIFLIVFTIFTLSMSGESYYYLTRIITNTFVNQEFLTEYFPDNETRSSDGGSVNFKDIMSVAEIWQWFFSVFHNGFLYENNQTFLSKENKLLGPPRLMQVRVRNNSCAVPALFKKHFRDCYGYFDEQIEDLSSFGFKNRSAWRFSVNTEHHIHGRFGIYPTNHFIQDLTVNKEENERIFKELYSGSWISRATRAVIVEFSIYNPNLDIFCFAQFLMEQLPTGMIVTSFNVQSVHLFNYQSNSDLIIAGMGIVILLLILYYTYEEIFEMYNRRLVYLTQPWNIIDLTIVLLTYTSTTFLIHRELFIREKLDKYLAAPEEFVDFEIFVERQRHFKNLMGVCLFLVWIKSLKYLSFNKTMMQFSTTLSRCFRDLLGFGLMFLIVFIAYAQMGYIAFGAELEDFHSFSTATFTLFGTILGEFHYLEINKANHILGPIYFMSYIFFVFFVLLNMFIAIINDTYSDVKWEITHDSVPVGDFILRKCTRFWKTICPCLSCKKPELEAVTTDLDQTQPIRVITERIQPKARDESATLEQRIEILEHETQLMVTRIDAFIKNMTRSVN